MGSRSGSVLPGKRHRRSMGFHPTRYTVSSFQEVYGLSLKTFRPSSHRTKSLWLYVRVPLLWLASETVYVDRVSHIIRTSSGHCSNASSWASLFSILECIFLGWPTRSSPIGPAEHDDGGSLSVSISQTFRIFTWCSETNRAHVPLIFFLASCRETHRPRSVSSLLILLSAILIVDRLL